MAVILVGVFQLLALRCLGSFHAIGPPAAPVLHNIGSANGFNEPEFNKRFPEFDSFISSPGNRSVDHVATQSALDAAQGGYFWLTDPKYQHKVGKLVLYILSEDH